VNILRLIPTDVVAYRQLMLEAYELHPDAFTSSVSERAALPMSWWQARLSDAPEALELVIGAFQANILVGVAGLSFESRDKVKHKAMLFGMYVPSKHRHHGVGRSLVLEALAEATRRRGTKLVQLTVTHGNVAAQSLYERCGFVQFGIEPFAVAVGDGFVSKVHMWCDLERDRSGRWGTETV
jgi:ribosomal protein S18 acetylase RimI-like enzyme